MQNTNWHNVEKAIANLKKEKLLSCRKIHSLPIPQLAQKIKPSGFYKIKAVRLKALVKHLIQRYNGNSRLMRVKRVSVLRKELLDVKGIGEETANTILLYALRKPVFVIDAYTKRIFSRHGYCNNYNQYSDIESFFTENLPRSVKIYNEYHALLVRLAKDFCRTKPICASCPVKGF